MLTNGIGEHTNKHLPKPEDQQWRDRAEHPQLGPLPTDIRASPPQRRTDIPHATATGSYVFRRVRGGDGPKQKTLTPAPASAYTTKGPPHYQQYRKSGFGLGVTRAET